MTRTASPSAVSVVITTHNQGSYIACAIDSVLAQQPSPTEVIIVDDGSTDHTPSVVARYSGSVVRYIEITHRGAAEARNVGWQQTTSPTVAFLDADDWWHTGKLAAQLSGLHDDVGLIYCDTLRVDVEKRPIALWSESAPPIQGQIFPSQLIQNRIQTSTVLTRRDVLDEVDGFDTRLVAWEDIDLWNRISARHRVAYVDRVLSYYRMVPNSLSGRALVMAQGHVYSVEKLLAGPEADLLTKAQKAQARSDAQLDVAVAHYLEGRMTQCRSSLLRALQYDPKVAVRAPWAAVGAKSLLGTTAVEVLRRARRN